MSVMEQYLLAHHKDIIVLFQIAAHDLYDEQALRLGIGTPLTAPPS